MSERGVQRPSVDLSDEGVPHSPPRATSAQAFMWQTEDFVPGHLGFHASFWENEILTVCDTEERQKFLRWIRGVDIAEFVDPEAEGVFQGRRYKGAELTSIELPNHVPEEFHGFVDQQISKYLRTGVIVPWDEVADVNIHPRPHIVLPSGVEESKPRHFVDARWTNLMMKRFPFKMDAVGKVAQCAWPGAFQMTVDHKSGFHHVPLAKDSWQYFGMEWGGRYYVFTTLCFGWSVSPFIYHSLSDVVSRYLRTKGIPMLTWIDDFYFTNRRSTRLLEAAQQQRAAEEAAYLVMNTFYQAGYFMSIDKCQLEATTSLVFLGVTCDSARQKFYIPEDKLAKLEAIISEALERRVISFHMLEKVAGKCTSMSVACPAAALYTHHMYQQIANFQRTGGRGANPDIAIATNGGLFFEFEQWLSVRERMNGASWYSAVHQHLTITGASDASSRGFGAVARCPGSAVFRVAGDFPDEWIDKHINEKEAYALQHLLELLCEDRPEQVKGSTLMIDVDNQALFFAVKKGRSKNTIMHNIVMGLFWLQVSADFTLKVQWVRSKDNAEADDLSRPEADAYVRLEAAEFAKVCEWAGQDFDMDLMATPASAQRLPGKDVPLPFYSRFHTQGCAGVDVLSQDLRHRPGSSEACYGFVFPPTAMVGVVLQRLAECKARAVVVVPDVQSTWYPMLAEAAVRTLPLSGKGEAGVFFRMHHHKGKSTYAFKRWAMKAVDLDFG